jgi:hypothetical protein
MTGRQLVLVFALGLVAAGAGVAHVLVFGTGAEMLAEYYPLEPVGRRWEYVLTEFDPSAGTMRKGTAIFEVGTGTFDGTPTVVLGVERAMPEAPGVSASTLRVLNHLVVGGDRIEQMAVEWKSANDPNELGRVTYAPPLVVGRLPLAPGSTWEASSQIITPRDGQSAVRAESKRYARVVGRETVEVPAGRFDALRFEIRIVTAAPGNLRPAESIRTEWRVRGVGLVRMAESQFDLALSSPVKK